MKKFLVSIGMLLHLFAQAQLPLLQVSSNQRYFQTADGKPFFWLGDTGWLLFVKCNRQDAVHYLDIRKSQGFNVIQVMVLHDMNNTKNVYGDLALRNEDVSKPNVTEGKNPDNADAYDYWDHVEYIVDEAAKRGMYMALVPVWGSNVKGGKVTPEQAAVYGQFLAQRFAKKSNIIWLNGGDIRGTEGGEVWEVLGKTIKQYDPHHLMTFHPRGRTSSSEWFHNSSWLDFNMFQSGHKDYAQDTVATETHHFGEDNWKYVALDYKLSPVKPTLDGEPSYENIPHGLHDSLQPRWTDADLRRYAYWSVFAGGAGFTYGENAVMQFNNAGDWTANYGVTMNWKQALLAPGATQMQQLKKLVESKDFFQHASAQHLVVDNGERYARVAAAASYKLAMFYVFTGRSFKLYMNRIMFTPTKAYWIKPATGEQIAIETFTKKGEVTFDPPGDEANGNDWVLVIEK